MGKTKNKEADTTPETVTVEFTRNCSDELGMHIKGDILDVPAEKAEEYYVHKWAKRHVVSMSEAANVKAAPEEYTPPPDQSAPKTATKKTGTEPPAPATGD